MLQETAAAPGGNRGRRRPGDRVQRGASLHGGRADPHPVDARGRHPARARRPQHRARRGARRPAGPEERSRRRSSWWRPPTTWCATCALFQQAAAVAAGLAQDGQARDVRHRRACAGDRLRLHPPRRGRAAPHTRWPNSSRSRRWTSRVSSSPRGDYYWNSGMFVFKAEPLSRASSQHSRPTSWRRARRPSRRPPPTSTSCASTRPHSRNAGAIRSTMR